MRWTRLAIASLAFSFGLAAASADEQEQAASGLFEGHGVVKVVSPTTGALTIAHDEIKGFMPAMEMMYRVRSPDLIKNLHPGDVIDFTIDAAKYVIVDIKLVSHGE